MYGQNYLIRIQIKMSIIFQKFESVRIGLNFKRIRIGKNGGNIIQDLMNKTKHSKNKMMYLINNLKGVGQHEESNYSINTIETWKGKKTPCNILANYYNRQKNTKK